MSVDDTKASEENKTEKIKFAKGAALFAGSVGAIGGTTAGVVKSLKFLGNSKKENIKESLVTSTDGPESDGINTGSGISPKSGAINTGPKPVDTNTEPDNDSKPKKVGIRIGFITFISLVYLVICRILENKLKNK